MQKTTLRYQQQKPVVKEEFVTWMFGASESFTTHIIINKTTHFFCLHKVLYT